jgi:hypothetical protein
VLAPLQKGACGSLDVDHRCVQILSLGEADAEMRRIPFSFRTGVQRDDTTSGKRHEDQSGSDAERLASTEHIAVEAGRALRISDVEVDVIDGARSDQPGAPPGGSIAPAAFWPDTLLSAAGPPSDVRREHAGPSGGCGSG